MPYQPKFLSYRTRTEPNPAEYPDNQNVDPSCDLAGATYVNVVPSFHPRPDDYHDFSMYGSIDVIGGGSPVYLITANGFLDTGASVQYVQFFDFGAPNPGDTPIEVFRLSPGAAFSWTPALSRLWTNGLYVAVSSTPDTYTASTEKVYCHAEFLVVPP
jgi:hypothetical protein